MKRIAIVLFLLAAMPLVASAQSYSVALSGASVVPGPGDPDGAGFGVITIDGTSIRYSILTQNIVPATGAAIYNAAGQPVVALNANTLMSGVVTAVSADVIAQIKANPSSHYISVSNGAYPDGALRGQLVEVTTGGGTQSSYIPVVGKVRGAAGTNFVTDLRIVNTGSTTANVTLDFFTQNAAGNAAPTVTKTIVVAPGEQKVLNDVVGVTLEQNGVLGGLRITADTNVVASARIINDLRDENAGTSGFAVTSAASGETSGTITFLSQNADYRTNIGYFNPAASAATVTLVARSSSTGGVLGSTTITVPGYAMLQQSAFALIASVPENARVQDDFYITWTSDAPLFVYGAVTDNTTGDAVLNQ